MKKYFNLEFLKEVLTLQSESGKEKEQINPDIHNILNNIQNTFNFKLTISEDEIGNIYITKNNLDKDKVYPCIVAHTDNVGIYHKDKTVVQINNTLIAVNEKGQIDLHGDDKVGMYIAFQALMDLPYCKVCLFPSEETSCQGSRVANLDFFKDVMFILQSDRKGNSDWITFTNGVEVCNQEFKDFVTPIIKDYNYKFERGTLTDVGELVIRNVGVCTANISSGYYLAHSDKSYCKISEVENCYNLMIDVCEKGIELNKKWEYTYVRPTFNNSFKQKSYDEVLEKLITYFHKEIKVINFKNSKPSPLFYQGLKEGIEKTLTLIDKIDSKMLCNKTVDESIIDILSFYSEEQKLIEKSSKNDCIGECFFMTDEFNISGPAETCINCGKIKSVQKPLNKFENNFFEQLDFFESYGKKIKI